MPRVVHSVCPHDCPDACSVLVTVEDGRAVKIAGNPEHPITRGFLCAKVARYLDRVYSPDRVLYPMRRVAPKGTGGFAAFQRISWGEALDELAVHLKQAEEEFGPESILPFSYGGTLGQIHGYGMDHRFFHCLGASQLDRTICGEAGTEAMVSVNGARLGVDPEDYPFSRYILVWGANIHGTNIHLWPFIEKARRNGARLVVIDPFRTRTAALADWHLAVRPGTDVALALGMMHCILRDGREDCEFLASHATGLDELRQKAAEYTPGRAAAITGLRAADVEQLAREYATAHPSVIRLNYGVQRTENGGMSVRAICMLPVLTGAWKERGGGMTLSTSGAFPLNKMLLRRPDLMYSALGRPARALNMNQLGRVLTDPALEPPVKALVVYHSNPAAVCPNHNLVVEGLQRPDLFTAVHEQFLTDTTDYADLVLPAATFLETKELVTSYGHMYLQLADQAIAPLGEAVSNAEFFRRLASRMGLAEECLHDSDDALIDAALDSDHPHLAGITRQRLEQEHSLPMAVPRTEDGAFLPFFQGFATPDGKALLASRELAEAGLDPVAEFVAPVESRHSEELRQFPLEFVPRKLDHFLNTTFTNLPGHQKMNRRFELQLHPTDAAARGIAEGDRLRVFNSRGAIELKAHLDEATPEGVVFGSLDWARLSPGGKNVNALTSDRLTDMGRGATFYSTLVEVERF
ncbi:MAG: molybdopterin oxidoreductase family protein [Acidobacteriota bacterium]|nr:molybdopterin oxidoreductase family protein [Acidobacteriota bacterium]